MRPRQMPRNFNYAFQNRLTFFLASMRPRQMPRNFHLCFNYSKFSLCCFNEAAADAAEFLLVADQLAPVGLASMRPRQMPRNFGGRVAVLPREDRASMRPRQMPRNFITQRYAIRPAELLQ